MRAATGKSGIHDVPSAVAGGATGVRHGLGTHRPTCGSLVSRPAS